MTMMMISSVVIIIIIICTSVHVKITNVLGGGTVFGIRIGLLEQRNGPYDGSALCHQEEAALR